jgi:hypothetical protein
VTQHASNTAHGEPSHGRLVRKLSGGAIVGLRSFWSDFYGKWTLAAIAGFLIGLLVGYSVSEIPVARQPEPPSMSQCVADTLSLFGLKSSPTAETLRDAREHCYSLIQSQGLLSDFAIRKLNFFQQYRGNGVLLWMVVAVTFSGVLLAGLQLCASYQLAILNKASLDSGDSELVLKRDQLVLKSSITGLFILLISFCFFLVFVLYIYRLEPLRNPDDPASPPVLTLPLGGLGPAPPAQESPRTPN